MNTIKAIVQGGRIKEGTEIVPLSQIIAALESGVSVNGKDRPAAPGEYGVLKVSAVTERRFRPDENKALLPEEYSRVGVSPRRGDVIVCRSNGSKELVASCGRADCDYPNLFLSDKLWRVVLSSPERDFLPWLYHVLQSEPVRKAAISYSSGSSGMRNVSKESYLAIKVVRPPFKVQVDVAQCLDLWEVRLRQLEKLILLKQRLKSGMGQQLLTGQRRFQEFVQEDWHEVRLQQVTTECAERNRNGLGELSVMAVTKADGIVPMKERLIGIDRDRYKVVQRNWFAYNPMRINIGSIARWSGNKNVVVSPDYVVFKCNSNVTNGPSLDPNYLDHLRRSELWESFVRAAGNGSVRVRIYYEDLAQMKIRLPGPAEQRRIVEVLNAADREIDLLRRQLIALRKQKNGLMQKLLTGPISNHGQRPGY